jgi:hypothetical protein
MVSLRKLFPRKPTLFCPAAVADPNIGANVRGVVDAGGGDEGSTMPTAAVEADTADATPKAPTGIGSGAMRMSSHWPVDHVTTNHWSVGNRSARLAQSRGAPATGETFEAPTPPPAPTRISSWRVDGSGGGGGGDHSGGGDFLSMGMNCQLIAQQPISSQLSAQQPISGQLSAQQPISDGDDRSSPSSSGAPSHDSGCALSVGERRCEEEAACVQAGVAQVHAANSATGEAIPSGENDRSWVQGLRYRFQGSGFRV